MGTRFIDESDRGSQHQTLRQLEAGSSGRQVRADPQVRIQFAGSRFSTCQNPYWLCNGPAQSECAEAKQFFVKIAPPYLARNRYSRQKAS